MVERSARRFKVLSKSVGQLEAVTSSENPKTAESLWHALPITGKANIWGDEICFSTPVTLKEENSRDEVEVGSVAYWPPGRALCIFFGETPASRHGEPRAASPVNVFGRLIGNPAI